MAQRVRWQVAGTTVIKLAYELGKGELQWRQPAPLQTDGWWLTGSSGIDRGKVGTSSVGLGT